MVQFLYPAFLFAAALIAIPVIIHLFNFRRYKTVYFTNVRFLREIQEETTSRSRIKHLLVLLSRILAILFLVLAFAQPFIPVSEADVTQGVKAISIYIDNSFSMMADSDDQPLLQKAREKAKEIAKAYSNEDRFQVITNRMEGRHQRLLSKDEFLSSVDEVEPSPVVKPLSRIQLRQRQAMDKLNSGTRIAFMISDFQKSITDLEADTTVTTYLVPLKSVAERNIYIDSAWLATPVLQLGQPNTLYVRLVNSGGEDVEESRLSLSINAQTKALSDFDLQAGAESVDTLSFTVTQPGSYEAVISINDYPITFDDKYYLAFKVQENNRVLIINDEDNSRYLNSLFSNDPYFIVRNQQVNQLDYASLRQQDLIVLNGLREIPSGLSYELQQYIADGGSVAVFPHAGMDIDSYNKLMNAVGANSYVGLENRETAIVNINTRHPIFQNVFEDVPENMSLPGIKLYYTFSSRTASTEEPVLVLRNGRPFMSAYTYGNGSLFAFATPLNTEYTDLPVHAIFVPLMYKMALTSQRVGKLSYTLGEDNIIAVDNKLTSAESVYRIEKEGQEFIPPQKVRGSKVMLDLGEQISEAGIYNLHLKEAGFEELIALNYNRRESELDSYSGDELQEMYPSGHVKVIEDIKGNFSEVVAEINRGVELWKLCIIFALAFIGVEILLLRLWPN